MWLKIQRHKKQLISIAAVFVAVIFFTNPFISSAIFKLLFVGELPGSTMVIPAWLMLIFWAVCGFGLLGWLTYETRTVRSTVPTSNTAYYHKATSKTPVSARKVVKQRAVRRRNIKLEH